MYAYTISFKISQMHPRVTRTAATFRDRVEVFGVLEVMFEVETVELDRGDDSTGVTKSSFLGATPLWI